MHQALTADALPPAAPSTADAIPADETSSTRDNLGSYFRDIATFDVMGREAELEAATRIVQLRRSF